ncbi:hypothetical protein BUALT_Bualt09G0112000 [Buddleja alternifolia]|uniref:E3 ubiquitin-protein ligase n=1 Tax=Buddleja alternifolia TaxID=168488 RepID=A0AAV6XCH4_9LAMI|nr:hypothetical protein BUALT_Bualt09G0112000 [Buddleja alternifolia]
MWPCAKMSHCATLSRVSRPSRPSWPYYNFFTHFVAHIQRERNRRYISLMFHWRKALFGTQVLTQNRRKARLVTQVEIRNRRKARLGTQVEIRNRRKGRLGTQVEIRNRRKAHLGTQVETRNRRKVRLGTQVETRKVRVDTQVETRTVRLDTQVLKSGLRMVQFGPQVLKSGLRMVQRSVEVGADQKSRIVSKCRLKYIITFLYQRLSRLGIPEDKLNQGQLGMVAFANNNKFPIRELVSAVLPIDEDDVDEDVYRESMIWLQWLMFEGDPKEALEHLAKLSANQRGVCGSIWGSNDIAYCCRTCEQDPTCAICVPCFENGKHKDHDYAIIYTGGGCCDCGDITAWKREGFCSKHKGSEQIQPLPEQFAKSLGPVLDVLLGYWEDKLLSVRSILKEGPRAFDHVSELQKAAEELTSSVVEMLLDFCEHSESLLCFISWRVYSAAGLLNTLLSTERVMNVSVIGKLHELLLKLLGEPIFKHEFAKVFVNYYPDIIDATISECSNTSSKKYPLLSTFSVQIFTVPTITLPLVEEMDLLGVLLICLGSIFISCAGEDGRLQVVKWAKLYEITLRVVEDIRFVMSHSAVLKYIFHSRRNLVRTWIELLAYVQGMNAQKRETGSHIEDEDDNVHFPFVLCHSISNILSLLVAGAFSMSSSEESNQPNTKAEQLAAAGLDDQDNLRHAEVGRLLQESSVSSITGKSTLADGAKDADSFPIPSSASLLIYECLRSMENCLGLDNTVCPLNDLSLETSYGSGNNFVAPKRTLSKFRRGRYISKPSTSSNSKPTMSSEPVNKQCFSPSDDGFNLGIGLECGLPMGQEAGSSDCDDNMLEGESTSELECLRVLSLPDWPDIIYDGSSQDISLHIPLHWFLSMVMQRALKECYGKSGSTNQSFGRSGDFLAQILEGCHPYGFSAFVMEHPLRIRVFCAEVHAGMWRRNGDAPILFREWYLSVRWSEQGEELDLFLLQCCAAFAPPDLYVQRILERFGLSNYLSLNLEQSSDFQACFSECRPWYETILVAEMLTLLIQIVKERRFCGLTTAECLQRELVHKLCTEDTTRSQLVKSLPHDLSKVDELQEVLDTVAEYSHPSGSTQGMYKLRPSYWKECDLYHPRWNSRDRQAAEERYSRFCNVSASITQLPRWTKIYYPLRGIAKIATCETLVQIVRAVLFYAVSTDKLTTSRASDGVLLTALHLFALTLDVCRVLKESSDPLCYEGDVIPVLAFAIEEKCMSKYGDQSMLSLLVLLHEKENAEKFVEAGNFCLSSLILSLIKTLAELEPRCMTKLLKLAPQLANQFSHSILNGNAKDGESAYESAKRKEKSRERQAAILSCEALDSGYDLSSSEVAWTYYCSPIMIDVDMEKMRAQQSKFLESLNSDEDHEMDDIKSEQEVCDSEVISDLKEPAQVICSLCHDSKSKSPVSYLVLLQKSGLLSFVDRGPVSWEQVSWSGKEHVSNSKSTTDNLFSRSISDGSEIISSSQLVDLVQRAVNDFASVGQPGEVNAFMDFIKTRFTSIKNFQLPCTSKDTGERTASSFETLEEHMYLLIRGYQSSLDGVESTAASCTVRTDSAESLLLGKYIAALPKEPVDNSSASQSGHSPSDRTQPEINTLRPAYSKFGPAGCDGISLSSCGHAVHQGCLDRYLSSHRERYGRRVIFEGVLIVDPVQGEFLCPVCRGLANSTLPALSGDLRKVPQQPAVSTIDFADVGCPSTSDIVGSVNLQDGLSLLQKAANVAGSNVILKAFPAGNLRMNPNLEPILRLFFGMYYPGQDKILENGRVSQSLILWDTLKYSLLSAEIAARSRKSSLSPNYSLTALYKELNSSSVFILSLLLDAIQTTRTTNSLTVLLRLRGIQLFARSLCSGTSPSDLSNYSFWQGGSMLYILENAEAEVHYPDIQLWRRASEPILARDAFSSLMWILFCLPWPILSCKESYLALVHVFYIVTVTQAIITYCKKRRSIETELGFRDCLVTDIYRVMGECGEAIEFFDCYYIDPAYDIKDSIRSLTFPYLRRCALLWRLMNCSNSMQFTDRVHSWSGSRYSADNLESATNTVKEISEVEELEKMFSIPPLGIIVNDEKSRLAALGWMSHFLEVFKAHKFEHVLRCTPAIPFKLMLLPHLYQDILQRYFKKLCPDCGVVIEEPALCLLCGKLCSANWKTCCRENRCETHAMACGAGTGVFLLVRRTRILLQRSARQALWPSPYLDAFGEEDVDMQRGKPLFLNEERYAALTHMVASHGIDRSSDVLRQTTTLFMF